MEQSVLDKITTNNWCYYYEGWRNGQKGGFVQKNGIYRFHEMVRNKGGILGDVHKEEDENPIVAIGIVAYWLIFNSRKDTVIRRLTNYRVEIPKDMKEQFDNYTKVRFDQFKAELRDDPNTWDWDWEFEFYTKYIIPHEIKLNNISEALFNYISDSDITLVRAVMNNYIEYLKKIRTEKGYNVSSELPVLRSIDSEDETKNEDLDDYEVNEEEWDDHFDFIFDKKINPKEVKKGIEKVKSEKIKDRRFYYVTYRILKILKWIPMELSESDYLRWINLHFNCGWENNMNQKKAFLFNLEGKVRVLKDLPPSEWEDDLLYSDLGKYYRLLAISLKNAFTVSVINGKPVGDSESFEHLQDRVEFLSGKQEVHGLLLAPPEAYINYCEKNLM